ncbi:MAG: anti-sigma factor [Opitutaceae bacterium]
MIDERQEEFAALYTVDLLEGAEKNAFEAALARDPALQKLVRELRESATALAHTAPEAAPPAELKTRLLKEIGSRSARASDEKKVVAFPSWIGWAAAACFALVAVGAGQLYFTSRSEAESLRNQQALADAALKSTKNQLEAERILSRQQVTLLNQQVGDATQQLADARKTGDDTSRRLAEATATAGNTQRLLAEATAKASDTQRQLAEANASASNSQRLLAEATERSQAIERLLANTRSELAALGQELKVQGDVANLKITTLASMLKNSSQAIAVAVWNPANQQGVLKVEKLPALAADRTYQLWVVDPQYADPVDGGTFTVDPRTGEARYKFTAKQPIKAINAYAITQEQKGGVTKSAGPFLLLGKEL